MAAWNAPSTRSSGRERPRYWMMARSSASLRWSAVIRQRAELAGQCDWWWKRPSSGDWSPESAGKPSAYCYIAKMEDVLGTYERPYDPEQPVVCLDEKPVTLHADVRPASPAKPGREARRDNEYERCGTANVFCAVEPKAGRHLTFPTPDRSGFEFAQVAVTLALAYPEAETIHLVMDNLNIHRGKSLADVFGAEMAAEVWGRLTVHYTPTHGSWLNQAEIEIGIFSRQCLGHRRISDLETLRREAKAWNRRMNRDRVKIAWQFDRKAARRKFGYQRNSFTRSQT